MKRDLDRTPDRRTLLGRALAVSAITAIAWAAPAVAPAAKLTKESLQYRDAGGVEGQDCDDCTQFIPGRTAKDPGTCNIVDGAVSPHGHCLAFSPKPR